MNLLDKRPLSIVIMAMLCGLVFYAYADSMTLGAAVILSADGIFAVLFLLSVILKRKRFMPLVLCLSLLFTFTFSHLYFDLWFKASRRFDGETVHIEGMVSTIAVMDYGNLKIGVKCDNVNGERLSAYKLMMNIPQEEGETLSVGAVFSFDCVIKDFENFSDGFNSVGYYSSLNYSGQCDEVSNITVTEYTDGGLEERLTLWRDILSRRAMMMSDNESGSFLAGLLLGEQKYMNDRIAFEFTRSGVSHILALSGMHFVILGFGLEKVLTLFNVNKKRQKWAIIAFSVFYTALTGCSPSVLRSGIMLVVSSLLYLFCGSRDTLTNMFISCALICFATPYSVYSMSLWLSVFSTLGICAMGEVLKESEEKNIFKRLLATLKEAFVANFFAVGAIMWLMISLFSGLSTMMIPANLLLGWLSDMYLYIGSLALIIGDIIPVGKLLIPIFKLIDYLVGLCAAPKLAYASTDFAAVKVLTLLFTVLYFAFLVVKVKRKGAAFCILGGLFASIFIVATVCTANVYKTDILLSCGEDRSDDTVAVSDGEVILINSSDYKSGSAYLSLGRLYSGRLLYVDKYIITHYTKRMDDMLDVFLGNMKTEEVYLPYPENDDEKSIADAILRDVLRKHDVEAVFYSNDTDIKCGELIYQRNYSNPYGNGTPYAAYTLRGEETELLYLPSGMLSKSSINEAERLMDRGGTVIFGSYGKRYSESVRFDFYNTGIDRIIMRSENLIFEQRCLMFYKANGCAVSYGDGTVVLQGDEWIFVLPH